MEKVIKHLSQFLGVDEKKLKESIERDNADSLKFDGMKVYKETDITEIQENFKKLGIQEAEKGFLSKVQKESGIEGNYNNISEIFSASNKKALADAKIEPDKKITELQSQLKTVQGTISEKDNQISTLNKKLDESKIDSIIFGQLPSKIPGNISRDEAAQIIKMKTDFIPENGKFFPTSNGEKLHDKKGNIIDAETFIKSKIEERKWDQQEPLGSGGKGGGHRKDGGNNTVVSISDIKSNKDYEEYIEANNITNSQKAMEIMSQAMQNKGFKADSE